MTFMKTSFKKKENSIKSFIYFRIPLQPIQGADRIQACAIKLLELGYVKVVAAGEKVSWPLNWPGLFVLQNRFNSLPKPA